MRSTAISSPPNRAREEVDIGIQGSWPGFPNRSQSFKFEQIANRAERDGIVCGSWLHSEVSL